jgi:hypothetical protein
LSGDVPSEPSVQQWITAKIGSLGGPSIRRYAARAGLDPDFPGTWLDLASSCADDGLLDLGAVAALDHALSRWPDDAVLRVRAALYEFLSGQDQAALARLAPLTEQDAAAAVLALRIEKANGGFQREEVARAADLVINLLPWGEPHDDFITFCRTSGLGELALQFLLQWIRHRGQDSYVRRRVGELMLELGYLPNASAVFQQEWALWPVVADLIGPWSGVPDVSAGDEAEVEAEIEHAFAIPESELVHHPLPDDGLDLAGVTVMYLGASKTGNAVGNDIAQHFQAAAAAAGGHLHAWFDSSLCSVNEARIDDRQALARVDSFVAELERVKPDILLLDAQNQPTLRSMTEDMLLSLKRRLGFRLVLVVRDALLALDTQLRLRAAVADKLIVFDPCSYVFASDQPDLARISLAIPVPALHAPFVPKSGHPQRQLTFVGSTHGQHRSFLLSVLATADIGLEMIVGPDRAVKVPTQDDFAALLADSRAVLNVAAHDVGVAGMLVTGRVWEAIGAGSLLVEQPYEGTMRFFTPWRHFLPWREPADIIRRWRVLSRRDDLRRKIADEAHAWACRHYGIDRVWRAVVTHAMRK